MPRVDRLTIGIFGRINAGKSTLMNLITQQETSIVDPEPGTTADVKSAVMEIHSIGPVRLLDTAGLDEGSSLGEKKRRKSVNALEEADLAILVIDPAQAVASGQLDVEEMVAASCARLGKRLVLVFNLNGRSTERAKKCGATIDEMIAHCLRILPALPETRRIAADLSDSSNLRLLVDLIAANRPETNEPPDLLPFLNRRGTVVLHIPIDEESPSGRLLRPQEMAMERLLRLAVPVGLCRVNLKLARSGSTAISKGEKQRFERFLEAQGSIEPVQLVLTDSQAIDVMDAWVPKEIPLTTFSIMMIHQSSSGNLPLFVEGTRALDDLAAGDKVLIAEACNHDRMAEDIGTVQIPKGLERRVPGAVVEHSFGREFPEPEELNGYKVVVHCGGCMLSRQKIESRVRRLFEAGVPVTNYGLALAWIQGAATLERVLRPWIRTA